MHIDKHEPAAWFGLMHLLATNVCLWFRTLVHEILEDFTHAQQMHGIGGHGINDSSNHMSHMDLHKVFNSDNNLSSAVISTTTGRL